MRFNLLLFLLLAVGSLLAIDQGDLAEDELVSLLDHYRSNPVNINTASENEIFSLPYISEITASNIYNYIDQNGRIENLNELLIKGIITEETSGFLSEIIVFESKISIPTTVFYQFRTKRIIERSIGYLDSNYLGNRSYFSNKFKFNSEDIKLNFLTEKEAGEISYTDNFKFSVEYDKNTTRVILGNFNYFSATKLLQYETMFIDPYSVGQSFKFHNFARSSLSSMDYYGYNGVFVSQIYKSFQLAFFYGEKPISVVLSDDKINSVNLNSYTRTETEIARYHNETHYFKGFSYQYISRDLSGCLAVSDERYSKELTSDSKLSEGLLGELALKKRFNDSFILEFNDATDLKNNNWTINSLFISEKTRFNLFLSSIEKEKLSLSSQGILLGDGEKENSIGFKVKGHLYKKANFILSSQFFNSEYEVGYLPGGELKTELDIGMRDFSFNCQVKYKTYEYYSDNEYLIKDKIDSRLKFQVKLNKWKISSYLKYSDWYEEGYGYLFSQSFIMNPAKGLSLRFGADLYYTTGSTIMYAGLYDIGLYPGMISYSGVGKSVYAFISYTIRNLVFTFGISEDSTTDSETISSGYDEINSNRFHRIEFNVKYLTDLTSF